MMHGGSDLVAGLHDSEASLTGNEPGPQQFWSDVNIVRCSSRSEWEVGDLSKKAIISEAKETAQYGQG